MNPDGTGKSQLTSNNGISIDSAWSPNGSQIAFSSDRTGDSEIWMMNGDGSNQEQSKFTKEFVGGPIWSPLCK
ncbi:MAG: hypothetical protein DRJ13_04600 [Bacteroidetes bacterium]|nr:MAG: hypothetical protein DRJ13_04600 [Bacteroidota bacterium]